MSVDTTIAVLYAQTGLGTQFANTAAIAPHASVAVSRVLAMETAQQERQQVEKSKNSEQTGISKDGHQKQKLAHFGSRRRRRTEDMQQTEQQETPGIPSYTGNLLNLTV